MKTLLLIGDSIRWFYSEKVQEEMEGQMKVVYPDENCRFSLYTLRYMWEWAALADAPEDVAAVHWNNGLWDLTRRTIDGECLTSKEDFARNLERIIVELRGRFPNAKIIWATITPVNPKFQFARNEDIDAYNEVALAIMRKHQIPVNDLHATMAAHPEYIRKDDLIHETEEGARVLARQVKDAVLKVLSAQEPDTYLTNGVIV